MDGNGFWRVSGTLDEVHSRLEVAAQQGEFVLFTKSNGDGHVLINPLLVEAATDG